MSLRDQLLKSGLANKEQTKKAEKQAKKRQHQELQAKKNQPTLDLKDEISQEIEDKLLQQQQADRERNRQKEDDRRQREAWHRAMDLMVSGDLKESRASIPYYFIFDEVKIGEMLVTEAQQLQLAAGNLAIVSFDKNFRFFLVDTDQAEKVKTGNPAFIICWHPLATELKKGVE
jgi:uncharacterized protein YaiL (DUF2058 family)